MNQPRPGFFECFLAMLAMLIVLIAPPALAQAPAFPANVGGKLGDGTPYRIIVPPNWNGTLLLDLDFATSYEQPLYKWLFERGYAGAGPMRNANQTLSLWVDRLAEVKKVFVDAHSKPTRTIVWGSSRGGAIAALMAERAPQAVDGAISTCGYLSGQVAFMNQNLDALFVAKQLLAPSSDLRVVGVRWPVPTPEEQADFAKHMAAGAKVFEPWIADWQQVLSAAQATPEGRARIALASTIAQFNDWMDAGKPRPMRTDVTALQAGLYEALARNVGTRGSWFLGRGQHEYTVNGNPSWNTDVDYRALLAKADPYHARAVRVLYTLAGLNLDQDLDRLDKAPRISADKQAFEAMRASSPMTGRLGVPLLTLQAIGDPIVPVVLHQPYVDATKRAGTSDLLRQMFLERTDHCSRITIAERAAALQTMVERIDTGRWPDTDPASMNRLAESFTGVGDSRYFDYTPARFNRTFP